MSFVQAILLTGRIRGSSPLSAILISNPELGKTSIVTSASSDGKCKCAMAFADVTGRGLMDLCKNRPEVSHFIINDLVAVMSHRDTVNRYTLAVINAITEEGISAVAIPGRIEVFEHGKRGIIACATPSLISDGRSWWNKHGLASRMLPFFFDHNEALSIRIKDAIETENIVKKNGIVVPIRVPAKEIVVQLPEDIGREVRKLSDFRAKKLGDSKGYRRLKQYRTLIRGRALARGEKHSKATVRSQDLEWLQRIDTYISYTESRAL